MVNSAQDNNQCGNVLDEQAPLLSNMPPAHSNPTIIIMEPILDDDGSDVEVMQLEVLNVDEDGSDDDRRMMPARKNNNDDKDDSDNNRKMPARKNNNDNKKHYDNAEDDDEEVSYYDAE